jgi:threonine dehydratase
MVSLDDIKTAKATIGKNIHRTPLIYSRSLSAITGAEVFIKAENLQRTGSFKVRGAFNKMARVGTNRVIAASMGNHAQAVAFAGERLNIETTIVMPSTVSVVKEEATRGYGAKVLLVGDTFQESLDYALSIEGYTFVHAYDDEDVIAGQGTLGLEITEELSDIDTIFVPVGGGGLVAGAAVAAKGIDPGICVIGVQTKAAQSVFLSFRDRQITGVVPGPTLADGIAVGQVGELTYHHIQKYVDDILVVDEDSIAVAILLLMERNKLVIEGAGAVPLAALMENKDRFRGKRVVLVASGGNIDFTLIDKMIYKGLLKSGRIVVFEVTVDDVPGTLQELSGIVAHHRGNILNVVHDRLQVDLPVGKTRVIFVIETRTREHFDEIVSDIRSKGYVVSCRE